MDNGSVLFCQPDLLHKDEIAAKCGYSNGNYFAKAFRENQKMSPTDYRKRMEKRYETKGTT